ncbi:uncharacterized protein ACRADG_004418 [Cochliomyia hominivorax]
MLKFLLLITLLILSRYLIKAQNQPSLCSQSNSMDFNVTEISGTWWEVARYPSDSSLACIRVKFSEIQTDNVMEIATTYSVSTAYLWVNQTMYANISLANPNTNGYNISYTDGIRTRPYTVYKLLRTDYNNYAMFCGYTNATNNATSFGILLTRERYPNITQLTEWENSVSSQYADFSYGVLPLVTQSPTCYAAGTVSRYSILATMWAFTYAILNITF